MEERTSSSSAVGDLPRRNNNFDPSRRTIGGECGGRNYCDAPSCDIAVGVAVAVPRVLKFRVSVANKINPW